MANPSRRAIQSSPSGFRRVPADNEGPGRQRSREVPSRLLAKPLAPSAEPDRQSHATRSAEVRRLQRAAGQTPRNAGTAAQTSSGDPRPLVPLTRGPTRLGTPNFLPRAPLWRSAAGRSPLREEAERALRLVAPEKPLQSRPRARSGQVSLCVTERLRAGPDLKPDTHTCAFVRSGTRLRLARFRKGKRSLEQQMSSKTKQTHVACRPGLFQQLCGKNGTPWLRLGTSHSKGGGGLPAPPHPHYRRRSGCSTCRGAT